MFSRRKIDKFLEEGNKHLKNGDFLKAKESYLKGLSIEPENLIILNNLSQIHRMLEDNAKALGYSEIVLEECNKKLQYEKNEKILLLKSNALISLGKNDEANEVFDELLKINSTNSIVLFQKAQYLELNNKHEEAIDYLDRILTENPRNVPALLSKGRNLAELEKFGEAEKNYNLVFEIDPKNMTAMNLKSKLLKKKNKTTISPHDMMIRAINAWDMEDFKTALAYFDKAIDLDSGYDEIWYLRGELLIRMGQITDAINSFKKAFKINPTSGGITRQKEFFKFLNKMRRINSFLGFEK